MTSSIPIHSTTAFNAKEITYINTRICTEWMSADFTMLPSSQWQWSCSQISWMCSPLWYPLPSTRTPISTRIPATIPTMIFPIKIAMILRTSACSEIRIGSISSDVDRKTAIIVPTVMTPPEYRFAAAAENPHCGTTPRIPPITGPFFPAPRSIRTVFWPALFSRYSIARYVRKRKGISFTVSIVVSFSISINSSIFYLPSWFHYSNPFCHFTLSLTKMQVE